MTRGDGRAGRSVLDGIDPAALAAALASRRSTDEMVVAARLAAEVAEARDADARALAEATAAPVRDDGGSLAERHTAVGRALTARVEAGTASERDQERADSYDAPPQRDDPLDYPPETRAAVDMAHRWADDRAAHEAELDRRADEQHAAWEAAADEPAGVDDSADDERALAG